MKSYLDFIFIKGPVKDFNKIIMVPIFGVFFYFSFYNTGKTLSESYIQNYFLVWSIFQLSKQNRAEIQATVIEMVISKQVVWYLIEFEGSKN